MILKSTLTLLVIADARIVHQTGGDLPHSAFPLRPKVRPPPKDLKSDTGADIKDGSADGSGDAHDPQTARYMDYERHKPNGGYQEFAGHDASASLPNRWGKGDCNPSIADYCVNDAWNESYGSQYIITESPPALFKMDMFTDQFSKDLRPIPKMRKLVDYGGNPDVLHGDLRSWGFDYRMERFFGIAGGGQYMDFSVAHTREAIRRARITPDRVFAIGSGTYQPTFHPIKWPKEVREGKEFGIPLSQAGCVDPGPFRPWSLDSDYLPSFTENNNSTLLNLTDVTDLTQDPSEGRTFRLAAINLSSDGTDPDGLEEPIADTRGEGFDGVIIPFTSIDLNIASTGGHAPDALCPGPFDHWEFHDLVPIWKKDPAPDGEEPQWNNYTDTFITTFSVYGMSHSEDDVLHVPRVCSPNGEWDNYPTFIAKIVIDRGSPNTEISSGPPKHTDPSNWKATFEVTGVASWTGFGDPDSAGDRPERSVMAADPVRCALYQIDTTSMGGNRTGGSDGDKFGTDFKWHIAFDYMYDHVMCRDTISGRVYRLNINGGDFQGDLLNSPLIGGGLWHRLNWNDATSDGAMPPGKGCDCEFKLSCHECGFAVLVANTPHRGIRSSGGAQIISLPTWRNFRNGNDGQGSINYDLMKEQGLAKDYPPWEIYDCKVYQQYGYQGSFRHQGTHCNPSVLFEENLWYILKLLKDDETANLDTNGHSHPVDYSSFLPEKTLERCYGVFRVDDDLCRINRANTGKDERRCFVKKKNGSCYVGYPLWDPIWFPTPESPYYSKNFVCRRDLYDYYFENPGNGDVWADMTKFFDMNYGMRNTGLNDIARWEFLNHWAVDSMNCYFDWIETLTGVKAVFGIGRDQREPRGSTGMRAFQTKPPAPGSMAASATDYSLSNQQDATPFPSRFSTKLVDSGMNTTWIRPHEAIGQETPGRPGKFGFLHNEFLGPINQMCLKEVNDAMGWWGHMRMEQRMVFNMKAGPMRSWQALAIPNAEAHGGISTFGGKNIGDHNYKHFMVDYLSANDIFDWNQWYGEHNGEPRDFDYQEYGGIGHISYYDKQGNLIKNLQDPAVRLNNKAVPGERFFDPETLQPISPNINVAQSFRDTDKFSWPLEMMAAKGQRIVNSPLHPANGEYDDGEVVEYQAQPWDTSYIQKNPLVNQFEYTSEITGYLTAWIYDPMMPFGDYDLRAPISEDIATGTQLYGWQKMVDRLPIHSGDNLIEGCIPDELLTNEDSPGGINEYRCVPLRAAICGPNNSRLDECTNFYAGSKFNNKKTGLLDDAAQNKNTFWRLSPSDEILDMNTTSVGGHAWEWNIPDIGVALEFGNDSDNGPTTRLNYRFDKCSTEVMKTTPDYPKGESENVAEGLGPHGAYNLGPGAWGPHTWGSSSICDLPTELTKIWHGGNRGNMFGVKQEDFGWKFGNSYAVPPFLDETPKGEIALAHAWLAQACYARQARAAGTKQAGPGAEGDHYPLGGETDESWNPPGLGAEKLGYHGYEPAFVE